MPLHILLKPASGMCNMRCKYCFYTDEMEKREQGSFGMMSEQTLENVIRKAIENVEDEITFAWQGGEPTLRGIAFFEKAVELQSKYNKKSVKINNALQTNGVDINQEWCEFFHKHHFLIGLSVDGTLHTHDKNRISASGEGTFLKCMDTSRLLQKHEVEFNILTVVNRQTAPKIRRIYQDYSRRGFYYQQYIACLEPLFEEMGGHSYSLSPEMYGDFLIELFQMWYDDLRQNRQPYIRMFENYIGILLQMAPESCEQNGVCGCQHVVEADGSVYPCDFYVLDAYRLGNLNTDSFEELAVRRNELGFIEKSENHSVECKACKYFAVCRGGCNRNRVPSAVDGTAHNYFCKSYKKLFDAHYEKMKWLAGLTLFGKPPFSVDI